MSYILDALRRADAERDRGTVPGIHAQPGYGAPLPSSAPIARKPWLWLAAGAGAVLVVGALAWYLLAPAGGVRRAEEAPAAPVANPAAPVLAPASPPPMALPSPPPMALAPQPPILQAPIAAAAPLIRSKPKPAAPAASVAEAAPKPAASAEKIYALNELPDEIRSQLPAVTIGGSMYSNTPADRLLIVNGQVAHEGDKIGNEWVLQQIRLKNAVLSFRGYRYTVSF